MAEAVNAKRPVRPWGTKIALVAIGLSFVAPILGLLFFFGTVPWVGALIASSTPVLGVGAIVIASHARRAAKGAGHPQWRAVLAMVLAALTVLPTSVLGGAVALVDTATALVPPGRSVEDTRAEPGWGWSQDGSACGSWTCARVPSGRDLVVGTVIIGGLIGLSAALDE